MTNRQNPELDKEDFPNSEYATDWATQMVDHCDRENLIDLIASMIDYNKRLREQVGKQKEEEYAKRNKWGY